VKDSHTPPRSVRISTELWDAAKAKAAAEGRTITEVIVDALRRYIRTKPRP